MVDPLLSGLASDHENNAGSFRRITISKISLFEEEENFRSQRK